MGWWTNILNLFRPHPARPWPPAPEPAPTPSVPLRPADDPSIPNALIAAHNAERTRIGLAALRANAALMSMAADHARWIASNGILTHTGADGDILTRAKRAGYEWSALEENAAEGQTDVAQVMRDWMSSAGHRANLLNRSVTEMGGAVARSASGMPFWCTVFGSPIRKSGGGG